jgi:riboflavin kinase/FMN adenylyltransferase
VKVFRDPVEVPDAPAGRAVTIGAFDGVHLGHQAVLQLVKDLARARTLRSTVLTFDRHPAEVVRPGSAPKLLTTLDQKLELLEATGAVDECVVITFDEARSKEPAEQFVEELLAGILRARLVVVGADFHFGYRRHGDVPLLQRMGAELGFETIGLGLVAPRDGAFAGDDGSPYSSTRVRTLLASGDVEDAAAILGRPHEVRGIVEHGDQRGRTLGFPTANVAVPERVCLPADGVYAGTFAAADGIERVAALSIGRRPTFYAEAGMLLLEAYLLDFDGDLYGQNARVRFAKHLREQHRFDSVDDLIAQMQRDVEVVRTLSEQGLW